VPGRPPPAWGEEPPPAPHVWTTLGYRGVETDAGRTVIEWAAPVEYCFHGESGPIVHGGLVTTLLDTAMGGACYSTLEDGETFLTADLNAQFLRPTRPGMLRAEGRVVHRTKRMAFCEAELFDEQGNRLATAGCTQVLLRRR
jgi:uncharacterized protein (TIGR00369 family)